MRYMVIAKRWDAEKNAVVNYIAGEFESYMCAGLFRDAYNARFATQSWIIEIDPDAYIN